jgi:hypothetical protein
VSVLAQRLTAQLLAGAPARDPVEVAHRLLAIQGQDGRGARLAIRARSRGVSGADIDRALTHERTLVITWLNRGTLHLVAGDDYPWLHALMTPPLMTSNARRLAQEGVDVDAAARAVTLIDRSLADEGPLTRGALRERLQSADLPAAGQALIHILFAAALQGVIVRGPMAGREHAYARVSDWLEPAAAIPREIALAELARRYLVGHGPASERDLARWSGLPLRDARAGLQAIAGDLHERPDGLVDLAGRRPAGRLPAPRLLGAFEPLLLGWTSRAQVLGEHESRVIRGGIFRAFALVRGRAAAGWRFAGDRVKIEPFVQLTSRDAAALERDGRALTSFLEPGSRSIPSG